MIEFFVSHWHTILILLLLVGGLTVSVGIALFHVYRYNGTRTLPLKILWSENRSLESVEEKVLTEKILLSPDDVLDAEALGRIKDASNKNSLIFDRLEAIINLQKSYSHISLDVLQAATATKEAASRTLEIPGYFVGFAMLVGLLGTIIGLSIMIGNMQNSLEMSTNFNDTIARVQKVLGSMQSAFWATIGGLICSVVSSLLNYVMHIFQARFYEKLDTFTIQNLLPLVYRSKEASDLLKKANANIEKTFSKLQNISQNITDSTEKLNAVHEGFNTIIGNVERITQHTFRSDIQQIFQQLSLTITESIKTNQSVQETVRYIPQVIDLMERNHQQSLDVFNQFLQKENKNDNFPARTRTTETLTVRKPETLHSEKPGQGRGETSYPSNSADTLMKVFIPVVGVAAFFLIMWILSK